MIALWDDTKFQVLSVEYGYRWIGLYGQHMQSGFICAIVGVYIACSMSKKQDLWNNLCILRHAFPISWLMVGDFNKTLNHIDRSSGYLHIKALQLLGIFQILVTLFSINQLEVITLGSGIA